MQDLHNYAKAHPEMRFCQIVVNAARAGGLNEYQSVFFCSDKTLISGIEKLIQADQEAKRKAQEKMSAAERKLEEVKDLVVNFPIRADQCDQEHASEEFINGVETVREAMLNLLGLGDF